MRWEVAGVALVLILASAPAFALPSPSPGPFLPRAPIAIASDADFTAANGVSAGDGSPGNPYVITGWSIFSSGTGIRIYNTTKAFLVRDNAVTARIGIEVDKSAGAGVVLNNKIVTTEAGIRVVSSDPIVRDNSIIGDQSNGMPRGIVLIASNSLVEGNAFVFILYGIAAERGSPNIRCNDIHDDVVIAGISLYRTSYARVECNTITRCITGISASETIGSVIISNNVTSCHVGIHVQLSKDADIANNTVRASLGLQVHLDTTSGNFTGNLVIDGRTDGVVLYHSPMLVANNTVSANLYTGIRLNDADADVRANVVSNNTVGIALESGSIPHLVANVMVNNTVGLDLPYRSRQAVVSMEANLVNGVNIDGSINASQRVYFYHAANVVVDGQVRDSGFSAGYYGSLTAQGGIVLWETDTATINATVVSHHNIGVGVINSFNVNVNDSLLVSNTIGVQANATFTGGQVPPCVVGVKRTNITIPVDPVATVGIDLRGCLGIVAHVNVSVVDYGIRADGSSALYLSNATVSQTKIGLDLAGKPNEVNITGAAFVDNRVGARFSNTIGIVAESRFQGNTEAGLKLERGSNLTFRRNNVSGNLVGAIDAQPCAGALTCSSLSMRDNVFYDNQGAGLLLEGPATLRADRFLANGAEGARLMSGATLRDVVASGNLGTGAIVSGNFLVDNSTFEANRFDGLNAHGNGELLDSRFVGNREAGLRLESTSISARHLNVSRNFDGIVIGEASAALPPMPPLTAPGLVGAALSPITGGGPANPFDIHRSTFLANERDGIRAGIAVVNATHNFWGSATGPAISIADTVGAFQNGVSPAVRALPWYTDAAMTTTGPVPGI